MDKAQFIANISDLFEDTDSSLITEKTEFKMLDEWSSLMALSLIAMVDEEYEIVLMGDDIRNSTTIADLYQIIEQKQ